MHSKIESLLGLISDYQKFCGDSAAEESGDSGAELSETDLDLVSAAGTQPMILPPEARGKKH